MERVFDGTQHIISTPLVRETQTVYTEIDSMLSPDVLLAIACWSYMFLIGTS